MLHGDEATLQKLKGKKVIIGGTALELGDRFSVPNGGIVSGPVLQTLAAESILQNRTLRWTSDVVTLAGLCICSLDHDVRRGAASPPASAWRCCRNGRRHRSHRLPAAGAVPAVLDTSLFHIAIAVYIAAIALDEIDFRDLLGRIAENRFQRIAMSLGDGLVCTDSNHLITVWNPGATAIFGYRAGRNDRPSVRFDLRPRRRHRRVFVLDPKRRAISPPAP